jgi:hypothetical protein
MATVRIFEAIADKFNIVCIKQTYDDDDDDGGIMQPVSNNILLQAIGRNKDRATQLDSIV